MLSDDTIIDLAKWAACPGNKNDLFAFARAIESEALKAQAETIAKLEAERDELAKDAARWRAFAPLLIKQIAVVKAGITTVDGLNRLVDTEVIDAAMQVKP